LLAQRRINFVVLAPTGRAARILEAKTALPARTIHGHIYAGPGLEVFEEAQATNDPGLRLTFALRQDEPVEQVIIVDESSMVGDQFHKGDTMQFGSGRLLHDLVAYARTRRKGRSGAESQHVKLLFVGDPAQLPPVGESASPALCEHYLLRTYALCVRSHELLTVMRQGAGSAILAHATRIRGDILAGRFTSLQLRANAQDMTTTTPGDAVSLIIDAIRAKSNCVVVVPTNVMARAYNRAVRTRVWGDAQAPVQEGDLLLVNKNSPQFSLANGDIVKVMEAGQTAQKHVVAVRGAEPVELVFRTVTVASRDASGTVSQVACLVLENLLDADSRELSPLQQRALLVHFRQRHPHLRPSHEEFRMALLGDPYFNALQVKYGYALTCHKAQGGEWARVVVDFGGGGGKQRSERYFRWVYTAITRASQALMMVAPPDFDEISAMAWDRVGFAAPASALAPVPVPVPVASVPAAPAAAAAAAAAEDAGVCPAGTVQDPDWERLGFCAAPEPLFAVHCRLRDAWAREGIRVKALRHLPYCERYVLEREGALAGVQYHYNGKGMVTRPGEAVPGSTQDAPLLAQALLVMQGPGGSVLAAPAHADEPFVQQFIARLRQALQTSGIGLLAWETMPYRLRVTLDAPAGRGQIDFTHDACLKWTAAQEVGGRGRSGGTYEAVQALLNPVLAQP
jgi:hypothetical protein